MVNWITTSVIFYSLLICKINSDVIIKESVWDGGNITCNPSNTTCTVNCTSANEDPAVEWFSCGITTNSLGEGPSIHCPTNPSCTVCNINCKVKEACSSATIYGHDCDILNVNAIGKDNKWMSIHAPNNGSLFISVTGIGKIKDFSEIYGGTNTNNIIIDCSGAAEFKGVTVFAANIAGILSYESSGECKSQDSIFYCPTENTCTLEFAAAKDGNTNIDMQITGSHLLDFTCPAETCDATLTCLDSTVNCEECAGYGSCCYGNCVAPTSNPTILPSILPTINPTSDPTSDPITAAPTTNPSSNPTNSPSIINPTSVPSTDPSYNPSFPPSIIPTYIPSILPSEQPTIIPSAPTTKPSYEPSADPSSNPTYSPVLPSNNPSNNPSIIPTYNPAKDVTDNPTSDPTSYSTLYPTAHPTLNPITSLPTKSPDDTFDSGLTATPNNAINLPTIIAIASISCVALSCFILAFILYHKRKKQKANIIPMKTTEMPSISNVGKNKFTESRNNFAFNSKQIYSDIDDVKVNLDYSQINSIQSFQNKPSFNQMVGSYSGNNHASNPHMSNSYQPTQNHLMMHVNMVGYSSNSMLSNHIGVSPPPLTAEAANSNRSDTEDGNGETNPSTVQ